MARKRTESGIQKKHILGIIIILLMVMSVLGIWQGDPSKQRYRGHTFTSDGAYVTTNVNDAKARFHYAPQTVEHISVPKSATDLLINAQSITVLFNPADPRVEDIETIRLELTAYDIPTVLQKQANSAITSQDPAYFLPIVSCENATALNPIVYITSANASYITQEGSCVIMSSQSSYDMYVLKDRLLYGVMGLIK